MTEESLPMPTAVARLRMPAALRALAAQLEGPFAGLAAGTRASLGAACATFAELIEVAEDAPDGGGNARPYARFLVSALATIQLTATELPLTEDEERLFVTLVEADLADARAFVGASRRHGAERAGERAAAETPQPPPPVSQLLRT
jgi:hypothetical protein